MHCHPDKETGNDVDERNDDPRNGIAADKLSGTVHCPEEVGRLGNFLTSPLCLFFVDETGIEIGINRHLPSRHCVQGESGGNFTHPRRTFGNDDELNDKDDNKNNKSDDKVSIGNKIGKVFDDRPSGKFAFSVSMTQNKPGCGDTQHEPKHRRCQQNRWENTKIKRLGNEQGRKQNNDREGDIQRKQDINEPSWQRYKNDADTCANQDRQDQFDEPSLFKQFLDVRNNPLHYGEGNEFGRKNPEEIASQR